METKIEKIKKFLEEQKQKSLEFYKSTKLDNFTGEVVAFDLVSEFIKELEIHEDEKHIDFDCEIILNGNPYKFNCLDDSDPLKFIMVINDDYYLVRDIDCDLPMEKWTLVKKYTSVINGVEKDETFADQVYHGKNINDEKTLRTLLEIVLFDIIFKNYEQDILQPKQDN